MDTYRPEFHEHGQQTEASLNKGMLAIYQVRLSEQQDWIGRVLGKDLFDGHEHWPSKNHVEDDVPIRSSAELAERARIYFDAALTQSLKTDQITATLASIHTNGSQDDRVNKDLYSCLPLTSPNEIRLLKIHPAGCLGDRIECELEVVNLDARPFSALSYVWGTEEASSTINVNGLSLRVKESLMEALVHLRWGETERVIWIDALCINQHDLKEKEHQVGLMGKIYTLASPVIVFFGPETYHSRYMFDFLGQQPVFVENKGYDVPNPDDIAVASWVISQNAWWRRYWVVQEFALPKHDPILQFGFDTISADAFKSHYRNMCINWQACYTRIQSRLEGGESLSQDHGKMMANLSTLLLRPHISAFWYLSITSGVLLSRIAGEPRDRVYAIRETVGPLFAEIFPPDYTVALHSLYARATVWFLVMEKFGDLWAFYPLLNSGGHASWTINLDRPFKRVILDFEVGDDGLRHRASSGEVCSFCPIVFDNTLVVDGVIFDEIDTVMEIDTDNYVDLIRLLWEVDRRCESLRNEHSAAEHICQELQHIYKDLYHPFMELGARTDEELPFSYSLLLRLLGEDWRDGALSGSSRRSMHSMAMILEQIGLDHLTRGNKLKTLDLILFDLQSISQSVQTWKVRYPAFADDFDEYFAHAVHLHAKEIGTVPAGFDQVAWTDVAEADRRRSIEEALADAHRLMGINSLPGLDFRSRVSEVLDFTRPEDLLALSASDLGAKASELIQATSFEIAPDARSKIQTGLPKTDQDDQLQESSASSTLISVSQIHSRSDVLSRSGVKRRIPDPVEMAILDEAAKRQVEKKISSYVLLRAIIKSFIKAHLFHTTAFCTKNGFRGFGSFGTRGFKPGDTICLIDGVAEPMVLRKMGNNERGVVHQMVGAVIVEGIMDGQAIPLIEKGILKPARFYIK